MALASRPMPESPDSLNCDVQGGDSNGPLPVLPPELYDLHLL